MLPPSMRSRGPAAKRPDRQPNGRAPLAPLRRAAYIWLMSWLPSPSSPRTALRDLIAFVRQREREHVIGASLAVLVTMIIVLIFLIDPKVNTAPPEQVTFVELYPSNRTDAQIKAD